MTCVLRQYNTHAKITLSIKEQHEEKKKIVYSLFLYIAYHLLSKVAKKRETKGFAYAYKYEVFHPQEKSRHLHRL